MGADSPLIISSSPSEGLPSLPIAPSAVQRSPRRLCNASSSPGLCSPSRFFRNRPEKLRSGSHAAELPVGAKVGFASAASIWRQHQQEEALALKEDDMSKVLTQGRNVGRDQEEREVIPDDLGKLVQPLKESTPAVRMNNIVEGEAKDPLGILSGQELGLQKEVLGDIGHLPSLQEHNEREEACGYAPSYPVEDEAMATPIALGIVGVNMLLETPNSAANIPQTAAHSKPTKRRRCKAKPEVITITSDGPESCLAMPEPTSARRDCLADMPDDTTEGVQVKAKKPRTKKTKVFADNKHSTGGPALETTAAENRDGLLQHDSSLETSVFFASPEPQAPVQDVETKESDDGSFVPTVGAPHRRRSWTPVADSGGRDGTHQQTFGHLIGSFSYFDNKAPVQHRTQSGEALPKRSRIEVPEAIMKPPVELSTGALVSVKRTKKPKSPKKKPQTITALATAAYQVLPEPQPVQETVFEYFSPRNTDVQTVEETDSGKTGAPMTAKKVRKPRAKPSDKIDKSGAKVAPKTKKTKAKRSEPVPRPPLFTPIKARHQMNQQQFLFGTSSQLAAEESPTFISQIQVAMQESETVSVSQMADTPRKKSYIKVPTAPHGTSLSVGQASREHWCNGSRDESGGVVARDRLQVHDTHSEQAVAAEECAVIDVSTVKNQDVLAEVHKAHEDSSLIGDSSTSDRLSIGDQRDRHAATEHGHDYPSANLSAVQANQPGDQYTMIDTAASDQPTTEQPGKPPSPLRWKSKPITSADPIMPSKPHRVALEPLDANASLLVHSPVKGASNSIQARCISTSQPTSIKRARGRPRKDAPQAHSLPNSPKRARGRPRKDTTLSAEKMKGKSTKSPSSKVEPAEHQTWRHIDDISDSDTPATPSPPRCRAPSSSSALPPLDLAVSGSPSIKEKRRAAPASSAVTGDSQWLSVQADVFANISAAVKSATRSADSSNPSWHEKILLYDPIVLEDLTAWLNAQGLRYKFSKLKSKAKARGRKKKGVEAVEEEAVAQYELVEEELKPWMVQKWCEEKSICCLWKEGLRGGVRARY